MDDLISRKAAIKAFEDFLTIHDSRGGRYTLSAITMDGVNKILSNLPPAQPEIVRCRDCEYNRFPATSANASCKIFYGMTDQNGFCHMAERREVSE